MSQNPNSIHYKYQNTLANLINQLKHHTKIVNLTGNLNRPLKIWRHQIIPHEYIIGYMIELTDIKHLTLYQEEKDKDREDILLLKQHFKEGINEYNNYVILKSTEIIPTTRFYIEVETYDGLNFQKGFPENDTPHNDIYDHDTALDSLGLLYNLPRRQHQTNLKEEDYPNTNPLFCNTSTEWDYYYETRLKNHIKRFGKVPLHIQMLESIFEITPQIEGRWRQVAHMEEDTMEPEPQAKYMASTNWNSNVYDIKYELKDLPLNLKIPNSWDIHNLLEQIFPIGAKIFFKIKEEETITSKIKINDSLNLEFTIKDQFKIKDQFQPEDIKSHTGY